MNTSQRVIVETKRCYCSIVINVEIRGEYMCAVLLEGRAASPSSLNREGGWYTRRQLSQ
jgi:hypothetical protein